MAPPERQETPWHSHITIDLLYLILSRSIFHPFIAWLIPLCLRAVDRPFSDPHVTYTCIYASIVTLVSLLQKLDQRFAYGAPRTVNWDTEVVVVTGGASGLGKILVETWAMRGVSVAVLDVRLPSNEEIEGNEALDTDNVQWYRCDVASAQDVERAREMIERDLGPPTILINNAGIVHGRPLLSLTPAQISSTINVNLVAHFNTLHAFLPSLLASPSGGTVVTVASVLGKLGAAHLSDYTAAKAGLLALHASLTAELQSTYAGRGGERVRTVLVAPGQLATPLFAGLAPPSPFFGPVVEPVELARAIVRVVDAGASAEIALPLYARWIAWMGVLPPGLRRVARWASGVDAAMQGMARERQGEEDARTDKLE